MISFSCPVSCGVKEIGHMGYSTEFGRSHPPGQYGRPTDAKPYETIEEELYDFLDRELYDARRYPFYIFSDVENREWVLSFVELLEKNALGIVHATGAASNPNHPNREEGIIVWVWEVDWDATKKWFTDQQDTRHGNNRNSETLATTHNSNRVTLRNRLPVPGREGQVARRPAYEVVRDTSNLPRRG